MAEQTLSDRDWKEMSAAGGAPKWLGESVGYTHEDGDEELLAKIGLDKDMDKWLNAAVEAPQAPAVSSIEAASAMQVDRTGRAPKQPEYPFKPISAEPSRIDYREKLRESLKRLQTYNLTDSERARAMHLFNIFASSLAQEVLGSENKQ